MSRPFALFIARAAVLAVAALSSAGVARPQRDPPSGRIDPPPGRQDYIGSLASRSWTFGTSLWKGREPCTADFCEAGYNADPLYILVQKQKNCCGHTGYSLTVVGRAKGCDAVGYYLVFWKQMRRWTRAERVDLLARQVGRLATAIPIACHLPAAQPIPAAELAKLFD